MGLVRGALGGDDNEDDVIGALADLLADEPNGRHERVEVDLFRGLILRETR